MNESTAERLLPVLIDLTEVVIWGGLSAGLIALWRPRALRTAVGLQGGLLAAVSLVLLPCFLTVPEPWRLTRGAWFVLDADPTNALLLQHHFDAAAILFLLAVSLSSCLLCSVRRPNEQTPVVRGSSDPAHPPTTAGKSDGSQWVDLTVGTMERSGDHPTTVQNEQTGRSPAADVWAFAVFQAAVQFVLNGDLAVQIALLTLTSVCCLFWSVSIENQSTRALLNSRRRFLFQFAADGLLLVGAMLIVSPAVTAGQQEAAAFDGPAETAVGLLFVCGAFGWLFAFPFFETESQADEADSVGTIQYAVVGPVVLLLLLRAGTFYDSSPSTASLLLSAGTGLALCAGLVAAARAGAQQPAVSLALSGMMLAGVGTGTATGTQGAVLLFLSLAVLVAIRTTHRNGRATAISRGLLLLGLTGQGLILSGMATGDSGTTVMLLLGTAQGLIAFALGRQRPVENSEGGSPGRVLTAVGTVLLVGLVIVLHARPTALSSLDALCAGLPTPHNQSVLSSAVPSGLALILQTEFLLLMLVGAIGFVVGRMMRTPAVPTDSLPQQSAGRAPRFQNLREFARGGFFLADLLLLSVILPLRGLAQLCRLVEWIVIERLWELPRYAVELLGRLGAPFQPQTVRFSLLAILLATAALLGVIVGLGS